MTSKRTPAAPPGGRETDAAAPGGYVLERLEDELSGEAAGPRTLRLAEAEGVAP